MPFNGSGSFSAPAASFPAVTATTIDSSKFNAVVNDLASGLTSVITKDGQTTVTANLPMATYRHTGVSDATALTDYASANQVVDNALTHGGASAAGTDTYAVNLAVSPGSYATKQRYQFVADVANTGACTINFSSVGAKSIKLANGNDPHDGAIQINSVADVVYDGTNFILINPFFTGGESLVTKAELDVLDGVTAGTTTASKALVVDSNKDIISLNEVKGDKFTAATGVLFGTDTAAANTLDDYEEGTWTPECWDDSLSGSESQTYSAQVGTYTKIGNIVHIQGRLNLTGAGTLTTTQDMSIGNLPFTIASGTSTSVMVSSTTVGLSRTNTSHINGQGVAGANHILLTESAAGGTGSVTIDEFSLGDIYFSMTYRV